MYPPMQPGDAGHAVPAIAVVPPEGLGAAQQPGPPPQYGAAMPQQQGFVGAPPPQQGFVGAPHVAAQSAAIAGLPDPATTVEGFIYVAIAGEWSQLRPNQVTAFDNAVTEMTANGAACWSGHDGTGMAYAVQFDPAAQKHAIQLGDGHFHPVLDRR